MKILKIILLALAFITLQAHAKDTKNLAVKESGNAAKRVALVIGNDHYSTVTPLKNAVADARSMAAALERAGFEVTLKTDANLVAMKLAVRQFKAKLSGGDEAVFFYSGHGVQMGAANYLLPVDITSDNEEQVKDDAIPLQRLLDDLQDQKVKFALAIIDACRDNPFKGSGRSIGGTRGLAPTSAANGQMVIFSAGNGQQALDKLGNSDRDANGVFTRVFLQEMERPGIEVHQVLRNVRSRVVQMAKSVNHNQMPALYDQVEGDFHFYQGSGQEAGGGTQVASLVPVPAQAARIKSKDEIEQETWDSVRDSNNIDAVNEYLKQYPKGRFAGQARVLIATLKKSPVKPAEPVSTPVTTPGREDGETMLWGEAQKGNSKEDYQAYLAQYPKGKYVALAKSRIKKLQDEAANEAARKEQDAWETAGKTESEDGYQSYLNGWPGGKYAGLAQVRLRKLQTDLAAAQQKKLKEEAARQQAEAAQEQQRQAALAARQERELWQKAEADEKGQILQAYLDKYPTGSHASTAEDKLAAIKKAEAEMKPGKVFKDCPDCPEMVILPKPFAMGKYEVTQGQWKAVMGNNPSHFSNCGDTCPVEQVSWNDVQEFIQKLNAKTGKQYRLPTEAEWEYACYGGSQSEYCGGNNLDAVGWYDDNSGKTTHPAGQKQANGYGLYDMSGNVWEWQSDCWNGDCAKRVLRGGSWYDYPQVLRAAYRSRFGFGPAFRYINYGFRLARMLP